MVLRRLHGGCRKREGEENKREVDWEGRSILALCSSNAGATNKVKHKTGRMRSCPERCVWKGRYVREKTYGADSERSGVKVSCEFENDL